MKMAASASGASARGDHSVVWAASCLLVLGAWCCGAAMAAAAAAAATSPDSAGLVGSSPERPTLPYKLWARAPKSALKPRRRDLREATLRALLGDGFEARWMRTRPAFGAADAADAQPAGAGGRIKTREEQEGPRESVSRLAKLAAEEALPDDLPLDAKERMRAWLVRRATCPVRYIWTDLGPYFWPRWVRRGSCAPEDPLSPPAMNSSAEGAGSEEATPAPAHPRSCSWPPGLKCVPSSTPKVLQLLHWHCRLRKSAHSNSVWVQPAERKKKRRKRFRCQWLKVPYPVPNDCRCVA